MDNSPQADDTAPATVPRGIIVLVGIAGIVVAVAGMKLIAGLIAPVFLALMLTIAVHPMGRWLRRHGCPAWLAALTLVIGVYGILVILFGSIIYSAARLTTLMPQYADKFDSIVDDLKHFLGEHGVNSESIHNMLSNVDAGKIISAAGSLLSGLVSTTSGLVLVLVVALFMAVDAVGFSDRLTALDRLRPNVSVALNNFAAGTRTYLVVSTVFGLIVAVLDAGALWALGIPLPLLWGLLSFITNYIPNIGFVLGVIPPAILGLLDGGWSKMLIVIVVYSAINVVIQSIIQPKFVGDAVGLSTTLTFLSLVVWTWILGPLGAILAVPLTIFVKCLLIDIDPSTRWVNLLIADSVRPDASAGPERHDDV
ncbi:AI-2E family transporter [Gordonia neofelifaecis]|uniref:Permease n=1 Tax=Gordonia neofelifaecis NRRL B-59395 TaxID=644548 RepID=F1YNN3_9ACTN|nr:AI-2E family transporter [Gordonia neofelifaecis]EGD53643.1 hypothetical protein SCNU_17662 [Gordonia neofelifaecis NRRL B-59395]